MSAENVDTVLRCYAAYNRRDWRWTGRDGVVAEMGGAQLWKLDPDGLITSFEAFDDWGDALEAAQITG